MAGRWCSERRCAAHACAEAGAASGSCGVAVWRHEAVRDSWVARQCRSAPVALPARLLSAWGIGRSGNLIHGTFRWLKHLGMLPAEVYLCHMPPPRHLLHPPARLQQRLLSSMLALTILCRWALRTRCWIYRRPALAAAATRSRGSSRLMLGPCGTCCLASALTPASLQCP